MRPVFMALDVLLSDLLSTVFRAVSADASTSIVPRDMSYIADGSRWLREVVDFSGCSACEPIYSNTNVCTHIFERAAF